MFFSSLILFAYDFDRFGDPLGCSSDLSGAGLPGSGISLALLSVPHGGADAITSIKPISIGASSAEASTALPRSSLVPSVSDMEKIP